MPRYFLTKLTVEGFRGINNEDDPLTLNFRTDAVNSVFAANGMGKSSIFEALHWAIHGTIPKLESLQERERPQDYYCNLFHSKRAASIQMEFQPDDKGAPVVIQVNLNANGKRTATSPSGNVNPEEFLAMLREAFTFLDYKTFIQFIEESPLKRGRTFSALLGLMEYSERRQALQTVSETRALNRDFESKVLETKVGTMQKKMQQDVTQLRSSYEKITGKPMEKGRDVDEFDKYAAEIIVVLGKAELLRSHVAGKSLSEIDFEKMKAAIEKAEEGKKYSELEKTTESIVALEAFAAHDLDTIENEQQKIKTLIDERDNLFASTRGDLFKRLYETAEKVILSDNWKEDKKCPLCESELSLSISEHVSTQLIRYANVVEKNTEIKNMWQTSTWKGCLSAYEKTPLLAVESQDMQLSLIDGKFSSGNISKNDLSDAVKWTSDLVTKITEMLSGLQNRKEELEKELPSSLVRLIEQVEHGLQFENTLKCYRDNQREVITLQARIEIRSKWKKFITKATRVFADAEVALSKTRIKGIDVEYKSMFGDIMRVDDVTPNLRRENVKENLFVQLDDFHGQHELSAQAILSESYRNALAISVFLASALKHSGISRFVVLDDVTSSFDAGHQYFLMELIRKKLQRPQNADGLQFIILSHDSLLEKYFDRFDNTTGWNHNKIQGSPPMGAILHQQEANQLKATIRKLLSSEQIETVKPLIRQYLECKLQQIICEVNIPVPMDVAIKDTSKMVGNYLDAITRAIELHKKAKTLVLNEQQIIDVDSVHVPAIVGNWVSHYATGTGSSLSVTALKGVIDSIDKFTECFRYGDTPDVRKWYKALDKRI